jgi:hypothetical protein
MLEVIGGRDAGMKLSQTAEAGKALPRPARRP